MQTTLKNLALVALLSSLPFVANAHGGKKEDDHDKKPKIDYSDVEEHAFGKASDPKHAAKTIEVDMVDRLRFMPDNITVKKGETVKFVVHNKGKLQHEMVLGTEDSLEEHNKMMMKFPGMEHDEPHMAHVDPGKSYVMGWKFTKTGTFHFGCLVAGHFAGGMKGTITVQ